MRLEGMDAAIRPTVNYVQNDNNVEVAPKLVQSSTNEEPEQPQQKVSEAFVRKAVDKANQTMQEHGRSLEFKIHEKTHDIIVKIVDTETKEVIREIPSEKMLDMFANMLELAGLIVDERR